MIALAVWDFECFGQPISFSELLSQKFRIISKGNKPTMATKDQIRKHLALSTTVSLTVAKPSNDSAAKKARVMEHVNMSKGSKN